MASPCICAKTVGHINNEDVRELRDLTQVKLNLEMAATDKMVGIAAGLKPEWRCSCPRGRYPLDLCCYSFVVFFGINQQLAGGRAFHGVDHVITTRLTITCSSRVMSAFTVSPGAPWRTITVASAAWRFDLTSSSALSMASATSTGTNTPPLLRREGLELRHDAPHALRHAGDVVEVLRRRLGFVALDEAARIIGQRGQRSQGLVEFIRVTPAAI